MKFKVWNDKGTSIVEMAFVLPMLLLLVFGMIEFGVYLYNKALITNASREGARYGIVQALTRPSEAEIQGIIQNYLYPESLNNQSILINIGGENSPPAVEAPDAPCSGFGDTLTVTVTYHYDFLLLPAFFSNLVGGLNISASTVMTCE